MFATLERIHRLAHLGIIHWLAPLYNMDCWLLLTLLKFSLWCCLDGGCHGSRSSWWVCIYIGVHVTVTLLMSKVLAIPPSLGWLQAEICTLNNFVIAFIMMNDQYVIMISLSLIKSLLKYPWLSSSYEWKIHLLFSVIAFLNILICLSLKYFQLW